MFWEWVAETEECHGYWKPVLEHINEQVIDKRSLVAQARAGTVDKERRDNDGANRVIQSGG